MSWLTVVLFYLLVGVGVYDAWLAFSKKETISQMVHALFPQKVDYAVMIIIMAATWAVGGMEAFVFGMLFVIVGHFFWHEDDWPAR